ncbi:tetratricopeptide repeat protein, partial [bacterium]|nr:tetratricopeptide repeat protein [bacterium]
MALDKAKTLKAAEKFVASGKIQQAIDEYSKILKENPRDWLLMITIGDLFLKINKTPEAIQHFQKVADHYYLDGFYLKAIAIYKRINKLDPNLTDICIKLADLYLKQGLTMDAKSQLQVVAQHYLSKNQNKDAIVTLKKLIEIEPENLRTRNELAKAYKSEGMTSEAIKEYIEISDELLRKNLTKESLTVLETAYKMDPRNAAILRKILTAYKDQNEQDKATTILEESLRSDPSNPDVLALLAESYAEEGEYSRAHETIEQAIFHTGNKEPFWILKGDLYLKEGDLDRAYDT